MRRSLVAALRLLGASTSASAALVSITITGQGKGESRNAAIAAAEANVRDTCRRTYGGNTVILSSYTFTQQAPNFGAQAVAECTYGVPDPPVFGEIRSANHCLDAVNGGQENGTGIQLYKCNREHQQLWSVENAGY